MRIKLVHLSDLHFRADRPNSVTEKTAPLVDAIAANSHEVAACLVVASGDIAFSGSVAEYELAEEWFVRLMEALKCAFPNKVVKLVLVPGNHDCDFSQDNDVRRILLDTSNAHADEVINTCTSLQANFREFSDKLDSGNHKEANGLARVFREVSCQVGTMAVTFNLINSAWTSRRKEVGGSLSLPLSRLEAEFIAKPDSDGGLSISVIHHPYTWFAPDNARGLRGFLEKKSDVILTGHEHEARIFTKSSDSGEQNEYLEGGVLQSDDVAESSFNAVLIDMEKSKQLATRFKWKDGRYEPVGDPAWRAFQKNNRNVRSTFSFSKAFNESLDNPGATFSHPLKDPLTLSDIFVYPDLRSGGPAEENDKQSLVKSRDVLNWVLSRKHVLIVGEEKSGKTSIARTLTKDLLSQGYVPILLSGERLVLPPKLERKLSGAARSQFGKELVDRFHQLPKAKRAVIVDDFHLAKFNGAGKEKIIGFLRQTSEILVVLAGEELQLEEVIDSAQSSLLSLANGEILRFGHSLRDRLIEKWYSLGREYSATEDEVHLLSVRAQSQISALIGSDLIPSFPAFLLILLQQLETAKKLTTASGSFGYLYEVLVTSSLQRGSDRIDLDTKYNYLSELAFYFFQNQLRCCSREKLKPWHSEYCSDYELDISQLEMERELCQSGMLQQSGGNLSFKYKYTYYFFVGTYLSSHIKEPRIQEGVRALSRKIFQEESANILLFLCHLSKDPVILETVMTQADSILSDLPPCDLDEHVTFLNELGEKLPALVLGSDSAKSNRRKVLEEHDLRQSSDVKNTDVDVSNDHLLQLNAALKTIQIMGQIARNFSGSLKGATKLELIEKSSSLGLRALTSIFQLVNSNVEGSIEEVVSFLENKTPNLPRTELQRRVQRFLFFLLERASLTIIRHVSDSIGSEKLSPTIRQWREKSPGASKRILDLSIRLDHFSGFPENEVFDLAKDLSANQFSLCIVRDLVWLHFYLFPSDYKLRQRVCEKLNISTDGQKKFLGGVQKLVS